MKRLLPWLMVALLISFMGTGSLFAQMNPEVPEDSIYAEQGDSIVDEVVVSPEDTLEKTVELTPSQEQVIRTRMEKTQNVVPLVYNQKTRSFIDYFTVRNPSYCRIMERRKNLYFPIFEAAMKRYGMPDEVKYLSIVESGLNPLAISHAGAAGLWQFMPGTGREYGLRQDEYIDERLDPWRSTEAACRYLKDLYRIFNDWELALASYNCGPGNIRRGIKRSGYKKTFWGIYNFIPAETRGYVPQFVAVTYTMNYLPENNIPIDSLDYPIAFDTIMITQYMNTVRFCEKTGICMEDLRELNPGLKRSEIPAYLKYSLRIPKDQMSNVLANRAEILEYSSLKADTPVYFVNVRSYNGSNTGSTSNSTSAGSTVVRTKIYHTVKRGESLGLIASKYKVGVADIKRWNKMRSTVIQPGQRLVIYRTRVTSNATSSTASTAPKTGGTAAPASASPIPAGTSKIVHVVKSGESLYSVAAKYKVTVTQLKSWNKLTVNSIQVGQKLIIYNKSAAPATSNTSTSNNTSASTVTVPKYYKVQNGDTLWSITQKYPGLSVDRIKELNHLKDSSIKPGQTLQLK